MILVGDIGGTKTLLEAGRLVEGRWLPVFGARYEATEHSGFDSVLRHFLKDWSVQEVGHEAPVAACFGVAGPVADNRAQMTNLPWVIDGETISRSFAIPRVNVINDFAAAAHGIALLQPTDLAELQTGAPLAQAPRLVIGAGTGLGVAHLLWADGAYRVVAGEAGHGGFAPTTPEQIELWRHVHAQCGRVTLEHFISGPGLTRIYEFVDPDAAARGINVAPAAIVARALDTGDAASLRALDLFIACYGEAAGNLGLGVLARGGVYVAGGIAPKILQRLKNGGFISAFNAKGSHSAVVQQLPVFVVLNEQLGLLGCASLATGGQ
jgi:glucokinase